MGASGRALQFAVVALFLLPGLLAMAEEDEVDRVALASVLFKDGHEDRARALLDEVDPAAEGIDLPRYHTLSGLLALRGEDHEAAIGHFEAALKAGQTDKLTRVFLAQARFGKGDFKGALRELDVAGAAADKLPGTFLLRAQALVSAGDKEGAWRALDRGAGMHPDHAPILRRRLMLLVELGLFVAAREEGEKFLATGQATVQDRVALAEALRRGGETQAAILFLEQARLHYPRNHEVIAQLGRTYLDAGKPLAAALLFEQAARYDRQYALDAAELFRRAGAIDRAVQANIKVPDQPEKIRQRFGILVEQERYAEAVAMQPRLVRLGVAEDDNVRYALAYAMFRVGDLNGADRVLGAIEDREVFRRAAALRQAMAVCAQDEAACQ